jgi:benzoyl-CoA-dihydrodiol lyase
MADTDRKLSNGGERIDFQVIRGPNGYKHWRVSIEGDVATLLMDVDENAPLFEGYQLKLNSYDLGVDIELADVMERMRFEHPEVRVVLLRSRKPRVFCAGANIRMLAGATHAHKVNFCKFTNETRNAIEDASEFSGQRTICVVTGSCAGGGYELALATDHIILTDDGSSTVSLPELPLLAVLPGTGGLTRVTDKRKVRRDHADVFCTTEEGVKGKRAVDWRLVDEVVPNTKLDDVVKERAREFAAKSDRPNEKGIALTPLKRNRSKDGAEYSTVSVEFSRAERLATVTVRGPEGAPPRSAEEMVAQGAEFWPLRLARELDDAILDIRMNEFDTAVIVFKAEGDPEAVLAHDKFLKANSKHWLAREIALKWKRVLKRVDLTSRSLVALVEPGSCFAGTLAELVFAADRSYMLIGRMDGDNRPPATIMLGDANLTGSLPMSNGLSRLATRFLGEPDSFKAANNVVGQKLDAEKAEELGLVTFALDDIDWEDEIRMFLEERASFSPDGLTGMEANLRFGGPETMETKIFARLTAWQNWIFQRPNAVGEEGALRKYGTGQKAVFDTKRV